MILEFKWVKGGTARLHSRTEKLLHDKTKMKNFRSTKQHISKASTAKEMDFGI